MQAGALRHRVEIQTATIDRDSHGGINQTWATDRWRWVEIRDLSGDELVRAQQIDPRVTVGVRMRYDAALTTADRIKHGSRILNIRSALNPDGRKIELALLCEEDT